MPERNSDNGNLTEDERELYRTLKVKLWCVKGVGGLGMGSVDEAAPRPRHHRTHFTHYVMCTYRPRLSHTRASWSYRRPRGQHVDRA
ncbi:hypothetical protein O3P69_020019 [Scylla paramamosain]|uniref:Uncharacterized protein n=1 Tax=Scylla paramamosain TaxID=85552 RepID=A0AAW0TJV8_SCYPA